MALHLMIVEDTAAEIEVYRRWTSERHVDGFVLVDLQHRDKRVPVLEELAVPAVVIGGPRLTVRESTRAPYIERWHEPVQLTGPQ